jgi:hypothetical protein
LIGRGGDGGTHRMAGRGVRSHAHPARCRRERWRAQPRRATRSEFKSLACKHRAAGLECSTTVCRRSPGQSPAGCAVFFSVAGTAGVRCDGAGVRRGCKTLFAAAGVLEHRAPACSQRGGLVSVCVLVAEKHVSGRVSRPQLPKWVQIRRRLEGRAQARARDVHVRR